MEGITILSWTLPGEGEVFGKEVVSRSGRIFQNFYNTFSKKGLVMNHFTTNLQRGVTAMKRRKIVTCCYPFPDEAWRPLLTRMLDFWETRLGG